MKRFAKYLLLILALTALIGAFSFSASAETNTDGAVIEVYDEEGGTLVSSYTTNALTLAMLKEGKYIKCNADVVISSQIKTPDNFEVNIDLGGNTLTLNAAFVIGTTSNIISTNKFTIKNGTVDDKVSGAVLQFRPGTSVLFDNLTINAYGFFINDGGSRSAVVKDCTVNITTLQEKTVRYFWESKPGKGGYERNYVFINTDFVETSESALDMYGFSFTENASELDLNVCFLNDCTVSNLRSTFLVVKASSSAINANVDICFADGFKHNGKVYYSSVNNPNSFFTVNTGVYESIAWDGASVTLGEKIAFPDYNAPTEADDFAYYVGELVFYEDATYAEYDIEGNAVKCFNDETIDLGIIKSFGENSTVRFFSDVTYVNDGTDDRIRGYQNNITFDLGGFTFYKSTHRWGLMENYDVTFKNGTIDSGSTTGAAQAFMGKLDGGTLTLTDVNIIGNVTSLIQLYNGNFEMTGGTIKCGSEGQYKSVFYAGGADGVTSVSLTNVTGICSTVFFNHAAGSGKEAPFIISLRVDGCEFETVECLFKLSNSANITEGSTASVYVKDSLINTSEKVIDAVSAYSESEIFFTNTKLSRPVYNATYGEGECMVETTDEVYKYFITKYELPKLKSNLTLYQDFSLNFYLPENTDVTKVSFGDTVSSIGELSLVNIGKEKYYVFTVAGISAEKAAETVTLRLTKSVDGEEYTTSVVYSIVDYADAVVNSLYIADAKELVVSAVNYIKAAYDYSGNTNESLDALIMTDAFKKYIPDTAVLPESSTDEGETGKAVSSVQMYLGTGLCFVINLREGFTGTVTVDGVSYDVNNGVSDELTYIPIVMRAHELYCAVIEIEAKGTLTDSEDGSTVNQEAVDAIGTYSLVTYIKSVSADGADEKLSALLSMLYTYCSEADYYRSQYSPLQ